MTPSLFAAVAYVFRDGLIASVTRKDTGQLSAPGGKIEHGETPHQAAIRELQEETGLVGLGLRLVYEGSDDAGYYVSCFIVDVAPEAELRAMEPGTAAAWVTPEALVCGFCGDFHRKALEAAGALTRGHRS